MKILQSTVDTIKNKFLFQNNSLENTTKNNEQVSQKLDSLDLNNLKENIQAKYKLKELKQNMEEKNIQPLDKSYVDSGIRILKSIGENHKGVFRFKLSASKSVHLIKENKIMEAQGIKGSYLYIKQEGETDFISDLNGKIILSKQNRTLISLIRRGKKIGKTEKEVMAAYKNDGQNAINGAFIVLNNYYL